MAAILGPADYAVIGVMLAVSAAIGLYFRFTGGRQKTTHEFLMAGKEMGVFPVAFSLMATYMSAISILGIPSECYMFNVQYVVWIFGIPLGAAIVGYGFLPVYFEMGVATSYEYLEKRFGKLIRIIASVLFTLQMILYMAVVLYAPSVALSAVTGLSKWASVVSLAAVCTFYCTLGGLKAVLWTDVFQSFLMYITIIAVVVKGSLDVGGFQKAIDIANEGQRLVLFDISFDLTTRYTFWNGVIFGIVYCIHMFGTNQAQIQRMMSIGDVVKARKALFWSVPLIIIFNIFCFWDGLVLYALFHSCDPILSKTLTAQDQLMAYAILKMFGKIAGLSGLCIAGVFSASLSTVSSAVNSLTAVTMEDFIRPYCLCKRITEPWAAFMAKVIALGYGGLCLLLTYIVASFRGVIEASGIMFGMVGGPMLGVFSLGMMTQTANEPGTFIGLLVGFVLNAWMGFGSYIAQVKVPTSPRTTEGCPVVNLTHFNTTSYNETVFETESSFIQDNEAYVFPVYRISFVWFSIISAIVVTVVGYIASLLLNICMKKQKYSDPSMFSPFVRKMFFQSKDVKNNEIAMKSKKHSKQRKLESNGHHC